jgi:diacylglycerol kinase (ATP)
VRQFDNIVIIYNPNSTGGSEKLARAFADRAREKTPKAKVRLIATEYPKHGEEIAADLAKKGKEVLLVSSSGDGGYHEIVNGLMAGRKPPKHLTTAVLPAGNANDHSRTMHKTPLIDRFPDVRQTRLDLLKVTVKEKGKQSVRYAHSYAGLGFTPKVALELNKHRLNPLYESFLVLKTFKRFKPFKIIYRRKVHKLDSLVFTNINQMAKFLTLAAKNRPRDGRFEVVRIRHRGKLWLTYKLLVAMVSWIQPQKRAYRYVFKTVEPLHMQLDGEVIRLPKDAKVTITIAHKALRTLV